MGDVGLIPVSGRSPGEGNGYPLQYSSLENSIDRETWWATVPGSQRVGHDWATFTPKKKKTKGTPQSFKTLLCWAQRQNASYLFSKHKSSSLRSEIHFRRKENEECGFQDFLKLDRVPSAYQLCQQRTAPESSSGEQSGYQDNTSERSLWSIALGMCCFQGCGLQKCLPWSGKAWLRERPRDSREAAL